MMADDDDDDVDDDDDDDVLFTLHRCMYANLQEGVRLLVGAALDNAETTCRTSACIVFSALHGSHARFIDRLAFSHDAVVRRGPR